MSSVFVDTTPLFALNSPRDQYFTKTIKLIKLLSATQLITTDDVINETLTNLLGAKKGGYRSAINLLEWTFDKSSPIHTEWIDQKRFFAAVRIFRRFNKDKQWSFTDCTSYVVMKELGIKTVFTFDEHFEQMGFKLLGKA